MFIPPLIGFYSKYKVLGNEILPMDIIVGTEIAKAMESMTIIVIAAINGVPALLRAKPLRS